MDAPDVRLRNAFDELVAIATLFGFQFCGGPYGYSIEDGNGIRCDTEALYAYIAAHPGGPVAAA